MPKVVILYSHFMHKDFSCSIGGIQTYIQLLIKALNDIYKIVVVQTHSDKFIYTSDEFDLVSVGHNNIVGAVKFIENELLVNPNDILIFASEQHACKSKWINTLVIQHGVYWDLPVSVYNNKISNKLLLKLYKIYDNYRNIKRLSIFKDIVCVDHNYINWFRTLTNVGSNRSFYPIMNCTTSDFFNQSSINPKNHKIKILFARRFVKLRGVQLFAEVAKKLVTNYDDIEILFVGDGPEEKWLKDKLSNYSQIFFKKASYSEMPHIMKTSDIVVVPSLGSEGTSLSAVEAMAAGKAVVATNVGGLTNIIVNNFNGLLSDISVIGFYECIVKLLEDDQLRQRLSKNAHLVAREALNFEEWTCNWKHTLSVITKKNIGLEKII